MGTIIRIVLLSSIVIAVTAILMYHVDRLLRPSIPPDIPEVWWGKESDKNDTSIYPFRITASEETLDDLKYRLKHTRSLTPALEGQNQRYGLNSEILQPILDYWTNEYDWPKREEFLNQVPHFKTNIQGLNIHFIHVKPNVREGTPILPIVLIHGWPSSVREYYKIIPILTERNIKHDFAFEVIVPSLPGYGFSDATNKAGLGAAEISVILKNLMLRLGHQKFYVHGGDVGGIIAQNIAILFPEHVLGLHTILGMPISKMSYIKLVLASAFPSLFMNYGFVHRIYPLMERVYDLVEETGFFHIQSSKPDTVAVGINDSPAGLAAYILEKFSTFTNYRNRDEKDAGLKPKFTYDELIDNLMFYWIPQTITPSMRLFAESANFRQYNLGLYDIAVPHNVPCAVSRYPNELYFFPDWILQDKYKNLVYTSTLQDGGHYPALEVPTIFAEDLFAAFDKIRRR